MSIKQQNKSYQLEKLSVLHNVGPILNVQVWHLGPNDYFSDIKILLWFKKGYV